MCARGRRPRSPIESASTRKVLCHRAPPRGRQEACLRPPAVLADCLPPAVVREGREGRSRRRRTSRARACARCAHWRRTGGRGGRVSAHAGRRRRRAHELYPACPGSATAPPHTLRFVPSEKRLLSAFSKSFGLSRLDSGEPLVEGDISSLFAFGEMGP